MVRWPYLEDENWSKRSDRGEEVSHMVGRCGDSGREEPGASWSLRKGKEEEGSCDGRSGEGLGQVTWGPEDVLL